MRCSQPCWCSRPWWKGDQPLGARIHALQQRCGGASHYDRLDLRLADMDCRRRLETLLAEEPPQEVAGAPVQEVIRTDGVKLRLGPSHWLMLRFSGTEPLLLFFLYYKTHHGGARGRPPLRKFDTMHQRTCDRTHAANPESPACSRNPAGG
jgi:Phosphomannomutase